MNEGCGSPTSRLTHTGLARLLPHNGGAMPGLQRGPQVSRGPTCWSRVASHRIAGAAWTQPEPASRTGGPRGWRWHFRDGFGSDINSRLEICDRIASASDAGQAAWCRLRVSGSVSPQHLHVNRSSRDVQTSLPGCYLQPVLLLLPSTIPKWYPSLLGPPQWPSQSTGSKILCVNKIHQKFGETFSETICCLVLRGYFKPVWNISVTHSNGLFIFYY